MSAKEDANTASANADFLPAAKSPAAALATDDSTFADLRTRPPLQIFAEWFAAANTAMPQAEAMTLATVDEGGCPQARTVLLKGFGDDGFIFFTNRQSRKGCALQHTPRAALLFYWRVLGRQVSAEGDVEELPRQQTAEYFATRPRQSRIGAWASAQSEPISSPAAFTQKMRQAEQQFAAEEPPLPPHWSGFRLCPLRLEFWREGEFRLHRRLVFQRAAAAACWQSAFLQP